MMMRARKMIENYVPGRTVKAGELFEVASPSDAYYFALAKLAEEYELPKKTMRYNKHREMRAEE